MNVTKTLLIGGGSVIGIIGIYNLMKIKRDSVEMKSSLSDVRLLSIDKNLFSGGIIFKADVIIENPTTTKFKISKPTVFITSAGRPIAQSRPSSGQIEIIGMGSSTIPDIQVKVGWGALIGQGANLIKIVTNILAAHIKGDNEALKSHIGRPLEVSYSTYINGTIAYKSEPVKIL